MDTEMHRIATTAIIFDEQDRVLITLRAPHKKVWPNRWTVPGGGLEISDYMNHPPTYEGETNQWYGVCKRAVYREVREEVGLEITEPWLVTDLAFIRSDGVPVLVLSYAAFWLTGQVTLDEDAVDYEWVTLEQARNMDLIDGIYDEIRMAFRMKERRNG